MEVAMRVTSPELEEKRKETGLILDFEAKIPKIL